MIVIYRWNKFWKIAPVPVSLSVSYVVVTELHCYVAAADGDFKFKIVQRGAVPPLVDMLGNTDAQLREMAAFALGRLAQNNDNQAGIVACGGLLPLLDLLESRQGNLQVR